jgi:Flp pilus assembly protein TadG
MQGPFMTTIRHTLRRFARQEHAGLTVEMVMVWPLLLWGYFGMFILFEGYRNINANIKVAASIADMLSRETDEVDAAYIEGLNDLQDVLTQSPMRTGLRVTVVEMDNNGTPDNFNDDIYQMKWSYGTAGIPDHTQATVNGDLVNYLPGMYHGEQLIAVETYMLFSPFLDISLSDLLTSYGVDGQNDYTSFGPFTFESISVTRPRFAPQLCFETCIDSNGSGDGSGSDSRT